MTKLSNIIQRRDLEPLMGKALKIVKHYEKAANCAAYVMESDLGKADWNSICKHCSVAPEQADACPLMHKEAVKEARRLRGSYIYVCPGGSIFWTSPFFAGERFAGALLSGGVKSLEENKNKVKALAQMIMLCADQISGMSFIQKNIPGNLDDETEEFIQASAEAESEINPIDMERLLLASLRRGDNVEAKKILAELMNIQNEKAKGNIKILRLKAIELLVLLFRAASNSQKADDDLIFNEKTRYLKKIEESVNLQEIKDILSSITDQMAGLIFSFHGVRHFSALRKAERFIWKNYTRKISLKEIAEASGLSATYFSTVFRDEMGEKLSIYLNRLRIEKAAAMLVTTNMPISEVASACGFEDQSWFSKIFKHKTGLTPGQYREQGNILN